MRLRLVANVRREQSKLDGLLANVCEHSRMLAFIEHRADMRLFGRWFNNLPCQIYLTPSQTNFCYHVCAVQVF